MSTYCRCVLPKKSFLNPRFWKLLAKRHQHSYKFSYEIPEQYQKTFFLANATLHDNIKWYFYRGVEAAYSKYVTKIKYISPCLNNETLEKIAINRINTLESTSNILQMNFPLKRDNGTVEIIKGHFVQHGIHNDIHLGGLRFCENLEKSHITGLANLSSYKYVNVDLPFAGAHSGLKIDPQKYSLEEFKDIILSFTKILKRNNFIGPNINIFEPDVNCTSEIMDYFFDSYKKLTGNVCRKSLACITGKSHNHGGLYNYEEASAVGIMAAIDHYLHNEELMASLGLSAGWAEKTYIIQGLGNVGQRLVAMLTKEGAKCIGVLEKDAGLYNKYGIDIHGAVAHKKENGNLLNFFNVHHTQNKVLHENCDMLIVASTHRTITCYTAPNLKSKMIIEAANGAITPTAHKILLGKHILVLPDIYVNCGATIASYMEHIKNKQASDTDEDTTIDISKFETDSSGKLKLVTNHGLEDDCVKDAITPKINIYSKTLMNICTEFKLGIDVRTAAYIMATQKIFDILQEQNY